MCRRIFLALVLIVIGVVVVVSVLVVTGSPSGVPNLPPVKTSAAAAKQFDDQYNQIKTLAKTQHGAPVHWRITDQQITSKASEVLNEKMTSYHPTSLPAGSVGMLATIRPSLPLPDGMTLAASSNLPFHNAQIHFYKGHIVATADIDLAGGFTTRAGATADLVTNNGNLVLKITSIGFGAIPIPGNVRSALDSLIGQSIDLSGLPIKVSDTSMANGELIIDGVTN